MIGAEELARSVYIVHNSLLASTSGLKCMTNCRIRISKLEHLDEIEELRLVLSHYVVAWGTKGDGMHEIEL